ncbi:MAG: DUF5615 family PIN-like protein [Candidatus Latescibacterota bacterium]
MAEWLRQQGHDVRAARDLGPDPGDEALLERAAAEGRVLVTMDKDFGQLVFADRAAHCGLIRLPDLPVPQRIALVRTLLEEYAAHLEEGAVVTVRGGRIRVPRAPGTGRAGSQA